VVIGILYEGIKQYFNLDLRTTITNSYFIISSAVTIVICILIYLLLVLRPAPKDRIVIAVVKFYPVTQDDKQEADRLQDRVIEALNERMLEFKIKGSVNPLPEIVDPQSDKGKKEIISLGEQYQAHLVIGGRVRVDEEYYFRPQIFNLYARPNQFSPGSSRGATKNFTLPKEQSFALKEQKIADVTNLAIFICGMLKVYAAQYGEAVKILDAIEDPSPEAMFYHGFALLQLDKKREALAFFDRALKDKPDFLFAYIYAGIVAEELGDNRKALYYSREANLIVQKNPVDMFQEDIHVAIDWLKRELAKLEKTWIKIMETESEIIDAIDENIRKNQAIILVGEGMNLMDGNDEAKMESLEKFELAIRNWPTCGLAWANKGLVLAQLKIIEQAKEATSKADEFDGDALLLARAYAALGNTERMLEKLKIAVEKSKSNKILARLLHEEFVPFQANEKFIELVQDN
jgi:tetratricopeptide (TPR) repeat protein